MDLFIGYIIFAGWGQHDADKNYWTESVKYIGSKYIQESFINVSLQLYIS